MNRLRTGATVVLTILAAGCASVPLSTMWRMRSFSPDDLRSLHPAELRAFVRTLSPVTVQADAGTIDVSVSPRSGEPLLGHFALQAVPAEGVPGLPAPGSGRRWIALGLTPEARTAFARFAGSLDESSLEGSSVSLDVSVKLGKLPPELDAVPFEVRLQLDGSERPFVLIKERTLRLSRDQDR